MISFMNCRQPIWNYQTLELNFKLIVIQIGLSVYFGRAGFEILYMFFLSHKKFNAIHTWYASFRIRMAADNRLCLSTRTSRDSAAERRNEEYFSEKVQSRVRLKKNGTDSRNHSSKNIDSRAKNYKIRSL